MIFDRMERHPGARFLLVLACLVVVVAGLKAAKPIMVPFALALFLAIVSMPIMFGLRMRRVPAPIAIFLTVLTDVLVFGLVILLGANSMGDLTQKLPRYRVAVIDLVNDWERWLADRGLIESEYFDNFFDPASVFDLLQQGFQVAASVFAQAFIVAIIIVFVLAEATIFPFKFQAILGHDRTSRMRITRTITEVQAYLGIKTVISLATGLLAGLLCWATGLDFPVLLGLVAFALNFIPTIGSIIAAAPAMVLALILYDWPWMLLVGLGYLSINMVFGQILEPNVMGRRMGLSTLVVVLSLLFWGWLWGPVGALLSVPLTMVLKIALENTPDLRWIAILLDKSPPQARAAEESASRPVDAEGEAAPVESRVAEEVGAASTGTRAQGAAG
jgi:AI-2 transport protein TqsA